MAATKQEIRDWRKLEVTQEFLGWVNLIGQDSDVATHRSLRTGNEKEAVRFNAVNETITEVLEIIDRMLEEAKDEEEDNK